MKVKLNEIKSESVVNLIKSVTEEVLKFRKIINDNLEKVKLEKTIFFIKKDENCFCNYRLCDEYNVCICLPYINEYDESYLNTVPKILNYKSREWPKNMLIFEFFVSESKDVVTLWNLSMYITVGEKVAYKDTELTLERMLNSDNIYDSLKIINSEYEKWEEKNRIREEIENVKITECELGDFISQM